MTTVTCSDTFCTWLKENGIEVVGNYPYGIKSTSKIENLEETANKLLAAGAERQNPKHWFPTTKDEAINDFGDPESEGDYYLQKDDCLFVLCSDGIRIEYVI